MSALPNWEYLGMSWDSVVTTTKLSNCLLKMNFSTSAMNFQYPSRTSMIPSGRVLVGRPSIQPVGIMLNKL